MATRTYQNVDFINYVAGFTSNTGNDVALASVTSNFNFTISSSGNTVNTDPPVAAFENECSYLYEATGDLDFDVYPPIPEGASIQSVEVKIDISVAATASATSTMLGPTCSSGGYARGKVFIPDLDNPGNFIELTDITFEEIDEDFGDSPLSSAISGIDHYSNTQLFDYTSAPIDKLALVAQFSNWLVTLECYWAGAASIPASSGTTAENSGFTFDGIRITVTYTGGGGISVTLNPSGGPVEIGQQVTASGPNAADLEYAAIIGDKVVPIIPKIINDDEVLLEIPYPSYGPCLDCFGDCPECDACVDSCAEDLTGEDCQACMQECLDCLFTCLEDLAAAEECQATAGTDGDDPTEVVIIAGTQFSGTVTLGNFTILVANGSGIYRFVLGKAEDTIYAAARDGTTYDVKIPNPGGKTGFFRS